MLRSRVRVYLLGAALLSAALGAGYVAGVVSSRDSSDPPGVSGSTDPMVDTEASPVAGGSERSESVERPTRTLTFTADFDTYVNADKPTFSYGDAETARIDARPVVITYLAFTVPESATSIVQAELRVYAISPSVQGFLVRGVPVPDVGEDLTYVARPWSEDSPLGSSGAFGAETWPAVDVSAYVTGPGRYAFALVGISRTAVSFGTRESGMPAELRVEVVADSLAE